MRRALLLATMLAAPVLGRAQAGQPAAGQITFTNTDANPSAQTINSAECADPVGTHQVQLNWTVQVTGVSQLAGITYQLWASNKASTGACPTSPPDTTTSAVSVGQITNQSALTIIGQTFDPALIASALSITNPNPCSIAADTTIYLCMAAVGSSGQFGQARATMTLSTFSPDVVPSLNTPILPGDTALNPTWNQNGSTNTQWYRVQAISVADPTVLPTTSAFDPNGGYAAFDPRDTARHYSSYVSGSEVRITGLQNNVTYALAVTGYTAAYNPSDPSNVGTGTPQLVNDFWEVYKGEGGREAGGCSSGAAGPVGLLVLAGALALVRRRK